MEKNILSITFGQYALSTKMHLFTAPSARECCLNIIKQEGGRRGTNGEFRDKPFYVIRHSEDVFEVFMSKDLLTDEEYKTLNSFDNNTYEGSYQFLDYLHDVLDFYY